MRLFHTKLCGIMIGGLCLIPACSNKEKTANVSTVSIPSNNENEVAGDDDSNRPPTVGKVTLSPADPRTNDSISVVADGSDPDGDNISFVYQWIVNGQEVLGEIGETLPSSRFKHGDMVAVGVIPHDDTDKGDAKRSAAIEIKNSPPELISQPRPGMSLDGFQMQVRDPDDDPITFKLDGAPQNMSLSRNGTLRWKPGQSDKAGNYEVTLTAEDGLGGSVTVRFPVQVTAAIPPGETDHVKH